jgi:hypothetical protein
VKVFDRLRDQLDPAWTVFYSRPWLGLTPSGEERDGEADFIVAHPSAGVLSIEVKGGAISYDPATEIWRSTDRSQIPWKIKDPVGQARSAKYELLKKLSGRRDWPSDRHIRIRHGVIFPDAQSPPGNLGADKPRELFCCRPDMANLQQWVLERLSGGDEQPLGRDGVQVLERLLAQPFLLRVPLGHVMEDDDEAIGLLTPEQFHILEATEVHHNRIAAGGAAGAGKTIVAMENAARLSDAGFRTLFVCMSPQLAADVKRRLSGTAVEVADFLSLARTLAAGASTATSVDGPDTAADAIVAAVERNAAIRFDAVIVDEAQDFRASDWVALDALLADPDRSRLHAFFDANQSLYGPVARQLAGFALAPVHLGRNLRNTRSIHQTAARFYQGLPVRADGPEGLSVEWVVSEDADLPEKAVALVQRLLSTDAVPAAEIAVLYPAAAAARIRTRRLTGLADRGIVLSSIEDFKGLERRVVLLLADRAMSDAKELAYVGLSRARAHLIVAGPEEVLSWLRDDC